MSFTRRFFLRIVPLFFARIPRTPADEAAPFGSKFPGLDSLTTGEWWSKGTRAPANNNARAGAILPQREKLAELAVRHSLHQ
jgi:hypothetical protein